MDAPPAEIALRCRGLRRRYGDVVAVDGLDLDVRVGECFGLLGPNGAGKTTTVELIEGLGRPDAGEIEILGLRWGAGRDPEIRGRLGVQLQETELDERLTVRETVRLFRSFFARGRGVDEVIDLLDLRPKAGARVGKLSGGQRQRLSLACALVGDPAVLCLDEPTTGLDPQARRKVWEVVEAFRAQGGTTLLTTHYMEEAARLADRIAVMDRGRVIALGTPAELVRALGADQLVELRVDGALDGARLSALPGVRRHEPGPDGAHRLALSDAAAALPALLADLPAQGATLRALTTHEPTLEDVFVHLTGRGLRDG